MSAADVRIVDVDDALRGQFLEYALAHGAECDDSYTSAEELESFDPANEPAVLAFDASGAIVGAASAMVNGYVTQGLARFRILHAADLALYPALTAHVLNRLPDEVGRAFLFLSEDAHEATGAVLATGFLETRRAYILLNTTPAFTEIPELPSETVFRQALPLDAEDWTHIVNAAFHGQPGRYDVSVDRVRELLTRPRVIADGTLIAWKNGLPAGVVLTVADADDMFEAEIETLAVIPHEQGKGLGRALLRTALVGASHDGRSSVILSVATTNRRALALYLDAGFHAEEVRVCWEIPRA
jgi:ribosomal protein S18 acetylase RimI-like enzyme